jgi:mRNA interferase MazF
MNQYDVYWVDLNPTIGSEINKIRPAVIISPNEMNAHLNTLIIAPMTSTIKSYPYRVNCSFKEKKASIALDQIRTIDKIRMQSRIGRLSGVNIQDVKSILKEMLVE